MKKTYWHVIVKLRIRADVAEIYSPPRVTEEAKKHGLRPGDAFDLTTGWDFRNQKDRDLVLKYIDDYKPRLIIGSPMCTMFSALQRLSPWTHEKNRRWCEAREHIKFIVQIYQKPINDRDLKIGYIQ